MSMGKPGQAVNRYGSPVHGRTAGRRIFIRAGSRTILPAPQSPGSPSPPGGRQYRGLRLMWRLVAATRPAAGGREGV
jgi:hypothetical protein